VRTEDAAEGREEKITGEPWVSMKINVSVYRKAVRAVHPNLREDRGWAVVEEHALMVSGDKRQKEKRGQF